MLECGLEAYRRGLTMKEPEWARVHTQRSTIRPLLLLGAEEEGKLASPRRGRSGDSEDLRKTLAFPCASRNAGRRVRQEGR